MACSDILQQPKVRGFEDDAEAVAAVLARHDRVPMDYRALEFQWRSRG